jgi:hypothetical protein
MPRFIEHEGNKIYKEVLRTRGYASASSTRIHLGLKSDAVIDRLEVYYPDGQAEVYTNLQQILIMYLHQESL